MTLEELAKIPYNRLLRLEPYVGWKKCWGWTGKYYDERLFESKEPRYMVQIRTLHILFKRYVPIDSLKELKDYER